MYGTIIMKNAAKSETHKITTAKCVSVKPIARFTCFLSDRNLGRAPAYHGVIVGCHAQVCAGMCVPPGHARADLGMAPSGTAKENAPASLPGRLLHSHIPPIRKPPITLPHLYYVPSCTGVVTAAGAGSSLASPLKYRCFSAASPSPSVRTVTRIRARPL